MADPPTHPGLPLPPELDLAALGRIARQHQDEAATVDDYLTARELGRRVHGFATAAGLAAVAADGLLTAAMGAWGAACLVATADEPLPGDLVLAALGDLTKCGLELTGDTTSVARQEWARASTLVLEEVSGWPELADPEGRSSVAVRVFVQRISELVPVSPDFPPELGGTTTSLRLALAARAAWAGTGEPVPEWVTARLPVSLDAPRRATRTRLGRLGVSADADAAVGDALTSVLTGPRRGDAQLVLTLAEVAGARTLLDGIASPAPVLRDPALVALEREATAYEPGVGGGVARQLQLVSGLPLGGTPEERDRRRGLVGQLENACAAAGLAYAEVAGVVPLDFVQAVLEPGQVLVRYVLPFRETHPAFLPHAVVVSAAGVAVVPLPEPQGATGEFTASVVVDAHAPLDSSPLGNAVVDARVSLARGDDPALLHERLAALHESLVAPVLATGLADGCDQWVVVPTRALHLVPWMALHDRQGRWLVDDASVTIAPSASAWIHLQARGSRPVGSLLALGDPVVSHLGLAALPGTRDEVRALEAAWQRAGLPATAVVGMGASRAALGSGAAPAGVLHVGTHGSFPDEAALFDQGFLLSPAAGDTGRVTADDLRSLPLPQVWCAVLALCHGGAYRVGRGDEPHGLVPALLEAGATTVLAPQWAVDDATAAALVGDLADHLLDLGPSQALRRAVLAQRASHDGIPGDYCAFVSIGTGAGPAAGDGRG